MKRSESTSSQSNTSSPQIELLVDGLVESMRANRRANVVQCAEDVLASAPVLTSHPNEAIRIVYEEICLKQEAGEPVSESSYVARFPHWKKDLHVLFQLHAMVQPIEMAPVMPEAGDSIGPLQLVQELGRGALGRVFLATENQLGCRLLVVKVTHRDMHESQLLSRFQHTHIVPLYFVHDDPEKNITAFCMPYLGGTTLDQIFRVLNKNPLADRSGKQFIAALDQFQRMPQDKESAAGPVRRLLAKMSYTRAVAWIGVCMADALSHVHSRNLVHLDIKPSNILMCADGQPMLLDFHLAREPIAAGQCPDGRLGGTWDYMPPEQRSALESLHKDSPTPTAVDHRADVYSLGAVLYMALTGEIATSPFVGGKWKQLNPQVSDGLADVIEKCLSEKPSDRYQDMESLAADLKSHLTDLPLAGVRNRSLAERWIKWRRRHPQSILIGAMVAAVLSVVVGSVWLIWNRTQERIERAKGILSASMSTQDNVTQALESLEEIPGQESLKKQLKNVLERMQKREALDRLHLAADRVRFSDNIERLSPDAQARFQQVGLQLWQNREELWRTAIRSNNALIMEQTKADLADIAVLLIRLANIPGQTSPVANEKLSKQTIFTEVESLLGSTLMVSIAKNRFLSQQEPLPRPNNVWERIALGRELLDQGHFSDAEPLFQQAIDSHPELLWPYFYKAIAAYRQSKFDRAVGILDTCIAIASDRAECYINRALCHFELGHDSLAILDATRALERNPNLFQAALLRSKVHLKQGQYDKAMADVLYAKDHGGDFVSVEYHRSLIQLASGDKQLAKATLTQVLEHAPGHAESQDLVRKISELP